MQSSPDEVRAALERVLASPQFAAGGRASSLLRYLVEQTLAGRGDALKEYVVGVELFGRGDQFDPRIDTIVRVEARRLRGKLDDYYRGSGASDPLRIAIPRGSYVPTVAANGTLPIAASNEDEGDGEVEPAPARPRRPSAIWVAMAALVAMAAVAAWQLVPRSQVAAESSGIRIAVLPLAHFSTEPQVAMIAARLTDGITTELARVPELSVVSTTTAARFASEAQPVREAAEALGAALVMEGSVVVEAGGIHAVMRIVDASRDRKVWIGEYDSPPDQIVALQRRIASEVAAAVRERYAGR
jgi:TolB-like protein